jgi:hypothetical protein
MGFRLRHAIWYIVLGLGITSLQVKAEVNNATSSTVAHIANEPGQAIDLFPPGWVLLVGVVLIALLVVTRNRNAP